MQVQLLRSQMIMLLHGLQKCLKSCKNVRRFTRCVHIAWDMLWTVHIEIQDLIKSIHKCTCIHIPLLLEWCLTWGHVTQNGIYPWKLGRLPSYLSLKG
jgi:hypothetical protein